MDIVPLGACSVWEITLKTRLCLRALRASSRIARFFLLNQTNFHFSSTLQPAVLRGLLQRLQASNLSIFHNSVATLSTKVTSPLSLIENSNDLLKASSLLDCEESLTNHCIEMKVRPFLASLWPRFPS